MRDTGRCGLLRLPTYRFELGGHLFNIDAPLGQQHVQCLGCRPERGDLRRTTGGVGMNKPTV